MHGRALGAPGEDPGAADADLGKIDAAFIAQNRVAAQHLRGDPRFRRMVDRLHRLGPRPVGELLIELAVAHGIDGDVLARLERFGELDPVTVAMIEAREWPPLPLQVAA